MDSNHRYPRERSLLLPRSKLARRNRLAAGTGCRLQRAKVSACSNVSNGAEREPPILRISLLAGPRVVFVAAAASLIARFWVGSTGAVHEVLWFAPIRWTGFAETLALAGLGALAGRLLRLPAAVPYFLAGLRISGGLALVGAVVAEFVAGSGGFASGLAYRIMEAGYRLQVPRMFAALVLLSLAGIAINFGLGAFADIVMRRRGELR